MCYTVSPPPFQAGSTLETQRQVIHAEPVTPRRLNPAVPRDLEAIVLKCLEKNPRKRYANVAEFREDLQRFLAGRPTLARPIGPVKRLGRWCRREPRIAALIAAILLILIAAGLAAAVVAEKRRALLAQREALLQDLDRSLAAQQRSTEQAAANFARANQAVADLQAVAARSDVDLQLRHELLAQIDRYLQEFLRENAGDPRLQNQRAGALLRRAQIAQELRSPRDAVELYQTSAELLQKLVRQNPQDRQLLRDLAGVHQGLASAYSLAGQSESALQAALQSRDGFQTLRQLDPDKLQFQHDHARLLINLGVLHVDRGEFPQASQAYQAAEEVLQTLNSPAPPGRERDGGQNDGQRAREVRADLAKLHLNRASLHHKTGNPDAARDENAKALSLLTGLVQEDPADWDAAHDLALLLTNTGLAAERAGRQDEALQHFRRAAELAESLRQQHPQVLAYQDTAADVQRRLGQLLQATGQLDEAAECLERSAAIGQDILRTRAGGNAAFLQQLIQTYRSLGRVHQRADRPEPMQAAWQSGIALCRRVLDHHPDAIDFAIELGMFYRDLGSAAERRSDLTQAADWTRQAVELLEPLVQQQPQEGFAARLLLENLLQYAGYLQAQGQSAEAIPRWEQAIRVCPLAPRAPSDGKTTADLLFLARVGLADSLHKLGDTDQLLRQAESMARENSDTHSHFTAARLFALAGQLAAAADPAAGDTPPTPRAAACYDAALKNLQQAAAAGYFASPENRQALTEEPDFKPIQSHPQFQKLLQQIAAGPDPRP